MIPSSSLCRYEFSDMFVCLLVVNLFPPAQPVIIITLDASNLMMLDKFRVLPEAESLEYWKFNLQ